MNEFIPFSTKIFEDAGFYVIKFINPYYDLPSKQYIREQYMYCKKPEYHYGNVYSFLSITPNTRDLDNYCDIGNYLWVNSYGSFVSPTYWRKMSNNETKRFKKKLYQFDRIKPLFNRNS